MSAAPFVIAFFVELEWGTCALRSERKLLRRVMTGGMSVKRSFSISAEAACLPLAGPAVSGSSHLNYTELLAHPVA
jgi:hypothetical protein